MGAEVREGVSEPGIKCKGCGTPAPTQEPGVWSDLCPMCASMAHRAKAELQDDAMKGRKSVSAIGDINFGRIGRETWAKIKRHDYETTWDSAVQGPETAQAEMIAAAIEDTVKLAIHKNDGEWRKLMDERREHGAARTAKFREILRACDKPKCIEARSTIDLSGYVNLCAGCKIAAEMLI